MLRIYYDDISDTNKLNRHGQRLTNINRHKRNSFKTTFTLN